MQQCLKLSKLNPNKKERLAETNNNFLIWDLIQKTKETYRN